MEVGRSSGGRRWESRNIATVPKIIVSKDKFELRCLPSSRIDSVDLCAYMMFSFLIIYKIRTTRHM